MTERPMNTSLKCALIAAIGTLPVLGFVYGVIACSDCNSLLSNTFGRAFIGLVHAVLIVLGGGRVLTNEGGTDSVNLLPYVIPTFFVFF